MMHYWIYELIRFHEVNPKLAAQYTALAMKEEIMYKVNNM